MRELRLKPSRTLGAGIVLMGVLAAVATLRAELPAVAQVMLLGGVVWSVALGMRHARRLPQLALDDDGALHVRGSEGAWQAVTVMPESLVSSALIVLRYRVPSARGLTLTLLPDSAAAEDLRRLRVSLRWARHTRSDTSSPDAG